MKTPKHLISTFIKIPLILLLFSTMAFAQMRDMSSDKSSELRTSMRKLWEDHIVWTRMVILGIMDGVGGTDKAVDRLMKNQEDIGNAIKPIYGDDAGNMLTTLLKEHISIAGDLLNAAKSSNNTDFDAANKKWYDNADKIADFLSTANPNWQKKDMSEMMHNHLALTTEEAVARLKKDYAGDVAAYDKVHDEILAMSDGLTNGIIKQFPDKFK